MKKYTIMIGGHRTVLAESKEQAIQFVKKDLESCHENLNLKAYGEL